MGNYDYMTDVVVVGSGSGALTAALAAREQNREVLVIESTDLIGGASCMSGGGLWIPDNPVMKAEGVGDSYENARLYMDTVIGDAGPASSPERREAFLREGPAMVSWLQSIGFRFRYSRGYPDYYPELPGGLSQGRALEGELFNLKELGKWKKKLRIMVPMPLYNTEARYLSLVFRTLKGFTTAMNVIFVRMLGGRLTGKNLTATGGSLIGQLLKLSLDRSIEVWLQSPLVELIEENGVVTGLVARKNGIDMRIGARQGVILAAGGFAHNNEMRQQYHPHPITTEWTITNPGDLGDGIRAGMAIGAATGLMDDAWWGPCFNDCDNSNFMIWERSLPFGFIVDKNGERFMNESASYVDCGHLQYERNQTVPAIPAYLIIDSHHRNYYPFGSFDIQIPRMTRKKATNPETGYIARADSLEELARTCGIDPVGLLATAKRFNAFSRSGKDEDFHRGDSAYDRMYSDPRVKPNANLGPVEKPPFYCVKVWPGDLGTKGGLLTDQYAQVLRSDGKVIDSLYATGNTSASLMGHTYPGPGSTIGPSMVFGFIAGRHAASRKSRSI